MQQTVFYPEPAKWIGWAIVLSLLAIAAGYWAEFHTGSGNALFVENGRVEGTQTIVLLVTALVFAARAWRSHDPVAFICIPVACILLHAAMRETPRCGSAFYPGGPCLTAATKYTLSAIMLTIMAVLLYVRRKDFKDALNPRYSLVFWPLGVAFLMLLAAELAESRHFEGIEEMLEMLAYCYAFACSIWIYRHI
ncbi:hypothetical protein ACFPLB_07395 [Aquamicrobium segne]|uniref:DUF998 domain-containing protein n=1 Tax=Aquamicrobium segne TaxID=469547 RepID=A0ABW0GVV0_9HYPH